MLKTFKQYLHEDASHVFEKKYEDEENIHIEDDPIEDSDSDDDVFGDEITDEEDVGMSGEDGSEDASEEDPNKAGLIRQIDGAHLVYKRKTTEGTYEELWQFNITDDIRDETRIRRDILSGTDIPSDKKKSEDGSQTYELTTMGTGQLLHIAGLPN